MSTQESTAYKMRPHNYVDVESMPWERSKLTGSEQKLLFKDQASGMYTMLYRMPPGGVIPFHEHPELEQTYVLKGKLVDDFGECTAGNFVWRAPGSRHVARCPEGAEFIVFFMSAPKMLPSP
jgi:quercetin dioxygenase-like cupin family protein